MKIPSNRKRTTVKNGMVCYFLFEIAVRSCMGDFEWIYVIYWKNCPNQIGFHSTTDDAHWELCTCVFLALSRIQKERNELHWTERYKWSVGKRINVRRVEKKWHSNESQCEIVTIVDMKISHRISLCQIGLVEYCWCALERVQWYYIKVQCSFAPNGRERECVRQNQQWCEWFRQI